MFELKVNRTISGNTEAAERIYKVRFNFNAFCDNDVMDSAKKAIQIYNEFSKETKDETAEDEDPTANVEALVNLLSSTINIGNTTRSLLFVGFKKYNPVDSEQEVGDIIDDYIDNNNGSVIEIFMELLNELINSGFFKGILGTDKTEEVAENSEKK